MDQFRVDRRRRVEVAAVGLAAATACSLFTLVARPNLLPVSDAAAYRLLGANLAADRGYVRPFDLALRGLTRPTAEFPPGFPTVLGALDLAGIDGPTGQRLSLGVAVAIAAMATVLLARRWFSTRVALAVGLVVALHPAVVATPASMGSESVHVAAITVLLVQAVRWWERPTVARAVAVGLAGGAAALVRAEAFGVAVAFVAVGLLVGAGRSRMRIGTAVVAVVALALLPGLWALRNATTFREPVLGSTNLVTAASGSYCDASFHGPLAGFWQIGSDCFPGFDEAILASADESVAAIPLRDRAWAYGRAHLDELPRVATIRVLRTFHLWEVEQQARLATFEGRRYGVERVTGFLVAATLPAAVWGAVVLVRRRAWRQFAVLACPIAAVLVTVALTYGNTRFRIGADIPLVLLGAEGIIDVARRAGLRRPRSEPATAAGFPTR